MIYIDELIILNFIIDYILICTQEKILNIKVKIYKKILSCLFGEISLIYLFINLNNIVLFISKILICLVMIYISFGLNDLIKNTIYYFSISFFLGGVLFYLKSNNLMKYRYILLMIPIIMNIYERLEYYIKKLFNTKYNVTIYLNNGEILNLNGFMDTGNVLIEPYFNRKVIIINKKIKENFYLVPYKTIDNTCLLKCFNPKKVYIDRIGERNDISVGVIDKKFKGYDCLLNYKLL